MDTNLTAGEIAKRLQQLEEEELQRNVQERSRGGLEEAISHHQQENRTLTEHSSRQRQYLTSLDNEEEEEGYPFRNDSSKHHNASDYRQRHRSSEREHSSKNPEEHPGRMISNRVSFGQVYYDSNNSKTPDLWKESSCKDQQVQFPYRNHRSSLERSPCHPSSTEGTSSHERDVSRKEEKVRGHRDKHCRHHSDRYRRYSSDSDDCQEHCVRDKRSRRSQWNQNHDPRHHRPSNKPSCRISSHALSTGEETRSSYSIEPLDWKMAELKVQSSDQLFKDEELARRLQEEEEKRIAKLKRHEQHEDFRAAQVAQDEEIAKYIQRQELKAHRRSEELDLPGDSDDDDDDGSICSFTDRRSIGMKNDVPSCNQGPLDSEGLASPTECRTPEKMELSAVEGSLDQTKLQSPRNIAEELDPTFKSKKETPPEVFAVCPQEFPASTQTQPVPVDGFYDFMDDGAEPIFIPPTKRQPEKLGRSKPKDKKEGCKQQ
ncbi:uncharacterized protein LOC142662540 isoform X2 [Rhinoderma darwinii]|uniref:uncharacterized protein LOC142662540 isoform X2 n=1 Tax=Rhinoderma darwinii TaxID=43563 RepID=UPI003F680FBC